MPNFDILIVPRLKGLALVVGEQVGRVELGGVYSVGEMFKNSMIFKQRFLLNGRALNIVWNHMADVLVETIEFIVVEYVILPIVGTALIPTGVVGFQSLVQLPENLVNLVRHGVG